VEVAEAEAVVAIGAPSNRRTLVAIAVEELALVIVESEAEKEMPLAP